eukprot:4889096-Pyramimonas_sp.AAC.1
MFEKFVQVPAGHKFASRILCDWPSTQTTLQAFIGLGDNVESRVEKDPHMAAFKDALFCNRRALANFESDLPEYVASSKVFESLNEQTATLHSHSGPGAPDGKSWTEEYQGTFKALLKPSENTLEKFDGDRLS